MSLVKSVVSGGVALLVGTILATQSFAATIDQFSDEYLGYYSPPEPASEAQEASYINNLIDVALNGTATIDGRNYFRSDNLCGMLACPDAVATGAFKDDTNPSTTITLDGDWTYLIGKYDGANAGSLVWYVYGLNEVTIPGEWGPLTQQYELSHWTVFTGGDIPPPPPPPEGNVPEPGSLALAGLALFGIAAARRRQRKQ